MPLSPPAGNKRTAAETAPGKPPAADPPSPRARGGGGAGPGTGTGSGSTTGAGGSSWAAKEAGGGRSADSDYLSELGAAQQYNINVDHGQNSAMIDSLFTGKVLGHKSDIADGTLRTYEFRTVRWRRRRGPPSRPPYPTPSAPSACLLQPGGDATAVQTLTHEPASFLPPTCCSCCSSLQYNNIVGDYYVSPRWVGSARGCCWVGDPHPALLHTWRVLWGCRRPCPDPPHTTAGSWRR